VLGKAEFSRGRPSCREIQRAIGLAKGSLHAPGMGCDSFSEIGSGNRLIYWEKSPAATIITEKSYRNGMDAPALYGISCAKVEVSSNHLNQQERPR
jgi:hypothetical protein